MEIVQTQKYFEIRFPFDKRKVEAVKEIDGAWFHRDKKVWHVPLYKTREINFLRQKFNVHEISTAADGIPLQNMESAELPELDIEIPVLKIQPYEYQKQGIAYCREKKKVIIGDQPGLGKTIQAIATICSYGVNSDNYFNAGPGLVICPSSLKLNWVDEFKAVAGHRAMILSDKIKSSWQQFYRVGMCDTFVVNYESLKKYFVQSGYQRPQGTAFKLNTIPFTEAVNFFKWVIIDESHKCLPYETGVITNKGVFQIGDIVENNRKDLLVASLNTGDFSVTYKNITNVWRNKLSGRKLYRIRHNEGELYATQDHKIFTTAGRYKKVCEIKSGESLYFLREEIPNYQVRQNNGEILLPQLCFKSVKFHSGNQKKNGQEQKIAFGRKSMRLVRQRFFYTIKRERITENKILRPELQRQMENETTGGFGSTKIRGEQVKKKSFGFKTKRQQRTLRFKKQANERKQSYEKPGFIGKNESFNAGKNIFIKRRQRSTNGTSKNALLKIARRSYGISDNNSINKETVYECSEPLQSRYCNTSDKISNRSGRPFSQDQIMEVSGPSENRNIKCVRVESCEIYEPTNPQQRGYSAITTQVVYDIEVADNHNYFADGILVSNCKDPSTMQAKLVMGISRDKDIVLELTGTPVLNRASDLVSQLYIVDRLRDVVSHLPRPKDTHGKLTDWSGYKRFMKRYCGTGGESINLKELNYRMNLFCFYRREKSEVLKDLPEKIRQVIRCDITNRLEYDKAQNNFVEYLRSVKGCTDSDIKRKLRAEILVQMGILKQVSALGKLEAAREYIDEVVGNGQKIVVFIDHHIIADGLKEMYPEALMITGRQSQDERNSAVQKFQGCAICGTKLENHKDLDHDHEPSAYNVMICSSAGGEGLTLTASSEVLMIEYPWTFGKCEQYEDRTHRISQANSMRAGYLLGDQTIDEYLYFTIILNKKSISQEVTGSKDEVAEEMVDKLLNLFNQKS